MPLKKQDVVHKPLAAAADPLARTLALAPVEDEEITAETDSALDCARDSLNRGQGIPDEEIMPEFGSRP